MQPLRTPIRVTVIGASGRMGRALVRSVSEFPDLALAGAIVSPGSGALGKDAAGLAGLRESGLQTTAGLADALAASAVAVDFSSAAAVQSTVEACSRARCPLLLGTTGYPAELEASLAAASAVIPLLVAPNTSIAVAVLLQLVRAAAGALPKQFDIEILEAHHRTKRDAPSGTALALGRAAGEARERQLGQGATTRGTGPRGEGEIGYAALRAGDLVGEHTVLFAGDGERLSLTHQATDRVVFARGALRAAVWLALQPAGRYSMSDVISSRS
jgi:4-hydroxy-tetrahydrodipicolinate reductase